MKRLTVLTLAALLMLCSCAVQPEPVTTIPSAETAPVTEPVSIYDADSKIEKETGGAIKAYPLNLIDACNLSYSHIGVVCLQIFCKHLCVPSLGGVRHIFRASESIVEDTAYWDVYA